MLTTLLLSFSVVSFSDFTIAAVFLFMLSIHLAERTGSLAGLTVLHKGEAAAGAGKPFGRVAAVDQ